MGASRPLTPLRTPPGVGPYMQPQPLPSALWQGAGHSSIINLAQTPRGARAARCIPTPALGLPSS